MMNMSLTRLENDNAGYSESTANAMGVIYVYTSYQYKIQ